MDHIRAGKISEAYISAGDVNETLSKIETQDGGTEYHIAGAVLDVLSTDAVHAAIREASERV